MLVSQFKAKQFDEGLTSMTEILERSCKAPAPAAAQHRAVPAAPSGMARQLVVSSASGRCC